MNRKFVIFSGILWTLSLGNILFYAFYLLQNSHSLPMPSVGRNFDRPPPPLGGETNGVRVVILVPCLLKDTEERMRVRTTYAQCRHHHLSPMAVQTVFYVGSNTSQVNDSIWQAFHAEQIAYNDIQWDRPLVDTYRNLSLKNIRALQWIVREYPKVEFVLKADIDVFINLTNLLNRVQALMQSIGLRTPPSAAPPPIIMGYRTRGVGPIRSKRHKWYVSEEEYPESRYPTYTNGHAYLLNRQVLRVILANYSQYGHRKLPCSVRPPAAGNGTTVTTTSASSSLCLRPRPILTMEDVFINGVLVQDTRNLIRVHEGRFRPHPRRLTSTDITMHRGWSQSKYTILHCKQINEIIHNWNWNSTTTTAQ